MSFFFPSPIPSKQDMFAKNAPELTHVDLCEFLSKMDQEELNIQKMMDNSPDSISEMVIEKLSEQREKVNTTAFKGSVFVNVLAYSLLSYVVPGSSRLTRFFTSSIISVGGFFYSKQGEEKIHTIMECRRDKADGRLKRLERKISDITLQINGLSLDSDRIIIQSDENQLEIAKNFFSDKVEHYQKIRSESPDSLDYSIVHNYVPGNRIYVRQTLDPETGHISIDKVVGNLTIESERRISENYVQHSVLKQEFDYKY